MINLFLLLLSNVFLFFLFILIWNKFEFLKRDHNTLVGEQQIHREYTPRIGGLAIFCILIILSFVEDFLEVTTAFNKVFLASMLPLVIVSVREDLLLNTKPVQRLIGIFASSAIIIFYLVK